jgi:hypothetical protein
MQPTARVSPVDVRGQDICAYKKHPKRHNERDPGEIGDREKQD